MRIPAPGPSLGGLLCPVMVGRDHELGLLQEAWRARRSDARSPRPRRDRQEPPGAGSSRLGVRDAGGIVLAGRCSPTAADVPLRPLREALLAAARTGLRPPAELTPFLPASGSLVPDWAETQSGPPPSTARSSLAEGVLRLMAEWSDAARAPTLLVVEDVHWSDPETLKVIEYLADNLAGQPILVVAHTRSGEHRSRAPTWSTRLRLAERSPPSPCWLSTSAQSEAVLARSASGWPQVPAGLVDTGRSHAATASRSSSRSCWPPRRRPDGTESSPHLSAPPSEAASVSLPADAARVPPATRRCWGGSSIGTWWPPRCGARPRTPSTGSARRPGPN